MKKSDPKQERDMRYGTGIPHDVPAGRVLAHNHIRHTVDMLAGINGFHYWTWPKDKKPRSFIRCNCGWSGLPHYALRPDYRCESTKKLGLDAEEFELARTVIG